MKVYLTTIGWFTLMIVAGCSSGSSDAPPPRGYSPDNPVTANDQWTPIIQEFNRVDMVLVPAGCFDMGSTDAQVDAVFAMCEEALDEGECQRSWFEAEQPVDEICFNEPFWIDRYEVTNSQFASFGGVAASDSSLLGEDLPRELITWFEASDFCVLRDSRLPTEAEWEYAARGPDNLVYPWGNTFVADNVVYSGNSGNQTASVSSRPGGVSWVGAYDLSGNLWEWVSTIYQGYPYDASDGREGNMDTNNMHVLRGGSWIDLDYHARAALRNRSEPSGGSLTIGFRCARSYE